MELLSSSSLDDTAGARVSRPAQSSKATMGRSQATYNDLDYDSLHTVLILTGCLVVRTTSNFDATGRPLCDEEPRIPRYDTSIRCRAVGRSTALWRKQQPCQALRLIST